MLTSEKRKEASYQIMILLGCIHIIGVHTSGLLVGIWTFQGEVFCSNPTVIYITGCIAVGSWCSSTLTSQILGINRCFVLYNRSTAEYVFGGWRRVVWLSLPVVYFLYLWAFTVSLIFNSILMSYVYNPHFGYADDYGAVYANIPHTANNIFVCCTESFIYGALIVLYIRATHSGSSEERSAASRDKRFYVQVVLVGLIHFIAGLTYVVIQFFPAAQTPAVIAMASTFYLLSQGTPPLIYIAVNRTLRNQIRKQLRGTQSKIFGNSSVGHSAVVTGSFVSQQYCNSCGASLSRRGNYEAPTGGTASVVSIERPQTAAANVNPNIVNPPISNVPSLPPINRQA
ncbi:hypothetical protein M3Y99_00111200 [Aphelenchoides fujianensis]|nr:hypothetical protein M3Y99_00111200 [Aphelenchoides fujianensis]